MTKGEIELSVLSKALSIKEYDLQENSGFRKEFIHAVLEYFNLTMKELKSGKRLTELVSARRHIMKYYKLHTSMSLSQIGAKLGHKDHATILHGIKRYDGFMDSNDKQHRMEIDGINKIYIQLIIR